MLPNCDMIEIAGDATAPAAALATERAAHVQKQQDMLKILQNQVAPQPLEQVNKDKGHL